MTTPQIYEIGSGNKYITFPDFAYSVGICGSFSYTATLSDGVTSLDNTIITLSSKTFTINSAILLLEGTTMNVLVKG